MGISIFPSTAAEFVSNNFVVDMNDTSNNTADTGGVKQAGPYSMSFSSGDSSFDVYLIDEDGNSVGYSNNTSIVASGLFTTVVILGVAQDEVVSFLYQGSVNNADGEGDEPGAGAYLESITPSDLPSIDDTATVIGGNFGADTEIKFESGATVLSAKNIVVNSSTELLVTRPDALVEDDSPYDLKAVNPGVTPPTGTNAHILTDAVTAGSDPTWVTTSPLNAAEPGVAFSQTLEATDAEGTVVDYSVVSGTITTGLSLDSSTGVLSGTPTAGSYTFTVRATDDGGNTTDKQFEQIVSSAVGGTVTQDGGFQYHTFTSSDDFEVVASSLEVEYLIVAGGGGGGKGNNNRPYQPPGGGGAGGLLDGTLTLSADTYPITIGAGGAGGTDAFSAAPNGSDTTLGTLLTAIGGGGGGAQSNGADGGSGGGAASSNNSPGDGTPGQGFDGGPAVSEDSGGGGGAGEAGVLINGGDGLEFSDFATATSTGDSGFYAGGGAGADETGDAFGGAGGGGDYFGEGGIAGLANTGGGGSSHSGSGGSGIVIVRFAI